MTWRRLIPAFLSGAALLAAGVTLADYLKRRDIVAGRVAERAAWAPAPPQERPVAVDVRMGAYLAPGVTWSRVREVDFGSNRSLFAAGPSQVPPEDLFPGVMRALRGDATPERFQRQMRRQPSAAALLRMRVSTGIFEGVAFFLRLPPNLDAAMAGRLVMEPGGILLGYRRDPDTWDYVTWYFPEGLDVEAFVAQFAPPHGVLDAIAPTLEEHLEPAMVLALGGDALGGRHDATASPLTRQPQTIFCRARGPTGLALAAAGRVLEGTGWRPVQQDLSAEGGELRILMHPGSTQSIWLRAEDRRHSDGLVTVLIGAP